MPEVSSYQGSQAFNQSFTVNEFVTRNTGSLNLTKSLVNLRGLSAGVSLNVNLSYAAGTQGLLGLPANWGFGIAYVVPGASLTTQGKTSVIDPTWSASSGYQSGLRYVNDHGVKFQTIVPPQPLPSGQAGTYSYAFTYNDGARDYYDATGKLVEHNDLFGNHINYFYTDPYSGVFGNRLDHIVDSFGQVVRFEYGANAIFITTPDGAKTTINYSAQGVQSVQDALGYQTVFTYQTVASQTVVATIQYPIGLKTQFQYTTIGYLGENGSHAAFAAVSEHYHLDANGAVLARTSYTFGTDSGGSSFTGASAGYRMSSRADSLMDSNNTQYIYDVLVQRLDSSGLLLAASRVYYNYLHLPVREEHYLVADDGTVGNGYRALHSYQIDADHHARTANYSKPVLTQQFVYSASANMYLPLRQSTASYDLYGCIVTSEEFLYDPVTQTYVSQMTAVNTYVAVAWGGQMPRTETYTDSVTGYQRHVCYTLTADEKNIAASAVLYRTNAQGAWSPWKTKSYAYDACGRVTSTTLAWSPGAAPPPSSIAKATTTNAYTFNAATRAYVILSTDALGNTAARTYDVGIATGPMIQATMPLGETAIYAYDVLGRITTETDALGYTTTTTYTLAAVDGVNSATAVGPTGYMVANYFDALGRHVALMDNGDPTKSDGSALNRTLREASYDALGRIVQSTDELGLITRYKYDSLSREVRATDPLGNVGTTTYDDPGGTVSHAINGDLRCITQVDGLGRAVAVTDFPDSGDQTIMPRRRRQISYDGFGLASGMQLSSVPSDDGSATVLYQASFVHNAEAAIARELHVCSNGAQVAVSRTTTYDMFGNAISYAKETTYADGRTYKNAGSSLAFDAAGRLASITNPLGQIERYAYDANGRLSTRTRFDGTLFTYAYDRSGQLLNMSWTGGSILHIYLPNGRVQSTSSGGATLQYAYYLDGSAKSVTYPDGRTQSYLVDKTSRVIASTDASGATTNTTFDTYGRPAQRRLSGDIVSYAYGTVNHTFGVPIGDTLTGTTTIVRELSYDRFGQTSAVVAKNADGQMLLSASYSRDVTGRLTKVAVSSETSTKPGVNFTRQATYDGLNQLAAYIITYSGGQEQEETSFVYDGNFNIIQRTYNGGTQSYTYNALDQLTLQDIVYDANGRMTADGAGRTYAYNALDQLVMVSGSGSLSTYAYHPDDSLASSTTGVSSLRFYYNAAAANAISTASGESGQPTWTTFLIDASSRRAAYEAGQTPSYYLTSGESTSLLQQDGIAAAVLSYDAYGALTSGADVAAHKSFLWNQEYADPSTGLVYLRARHYNPVLMTFMSMDNLTKDNRYAYCCGDPLNLVDPTGHMETSEIVGLIAGAAVGIVATIVTGGLLGALAAAVFGTESILASVGATTLAGAVGSIAGDATNAAIAGQKFTAERALLDLVSGTAGGAVGAGVGGYVGRAATSTALANNLSQRAITNIGLICSGVAGGLSGSVAASGVTSLMTGQPFFSANTAISMAVGAAAGVGGGFLTSGAYLGRLSARIIPVPLSEAEVNMIVPARNQVNAILQERLLVMAPQNEATSTAHEFRNRYGSYRSAQTKTYGGNETAYDTIAAHGAGNTMFASVEYNPGTGLIGEPNYVRPIKGSVFAEYLRNNPGLIGGTGNNNPIKLMSCFGAFSNAQTIADALQRPVFAGYPEINRYTFTNWKDFTPR